MNKNNSKRRFLSLSRIIYTLLLFLFITIFTARFVCKELECFGNWLFGSNCEQYCAICEKKPEKIYCQECERCKVLKPDWDTRAAFDDAGFIIIGTCTLLLILIIKNYNGILLIKSITKLSLFGTIEWELEALNNEVTDLENKKFNTLRIETKEEFLRIETKIIKNSSNLNETLILLNSEIEKTLKEIYKIGFPEDVTIANSLNTVIESLKEKNLIDLDLGNAIEHFFEVKRNDSIHRNGKNTVGLIELAKRLLVMLNAYAKDLFNSSRKFWGNPQKIKADRSKIEEITDNNIVLFTTISVSDDNNNTFPLNSLDIENFIVYEKSENEERKANVFKVEPIQDTRTRIMITIALDSSGSMKDNNKIEKSKEAIIALLNGLKQYSNLDCNVALYFVRSDNRGFASGKFFNKNEFDELISIVKNIQPEGGTPLWESISTIVDNYSQQTSGYQIIICLTDGLDTSQKKENYIVARNKVILKKIPFIFIGYGDEDYSDLISLAEASGAGEMEIGHFVKVKPDQIERIFEDIARLITKSYKVYWKPAFEKNKKNIIVRMKVKYKTPFGKISTEEYLEYNFRKI